MSDELPEGWIDVELPAIATLNMGQSPPSDTYNTDGKGLPFFQGKAEFGDLYPTPVKFCSHPSKVAEPGDILISVRAPVGPTNLCLDKSCIGRGLAAIRPLGEIPNRYLLYYLRSIEDWLSRQGTGSTFTAISKTDLEGLRVRLAPLAEQRRIVAKLESLLGKVDACQKRLGKIPVLLRRFRQSVLAAACSGRLTEDWRTQNPGVETAPELFTKITARRNLQHEQVCKEAATVGKRKPKRLNSNKLSRNLPGELREIPKTWGYFRLEELCHLITDGTHQTPEYRSSGVPFLSVKNVRPFVVRDDDIKWISEEEHRLINARCNPQKGDILYTKVGTFGYAAINRLSYPFSIFVSVALLKPVTPFLTSAYAEAAMNSEVVFNQARKRVSGIGTPDLHLVEIRDFRVPLPPLAEQHEIVRRVDALFALADQIEARYAKALAYAGKLTPSLLAKAFRGELVTTEAELAREEDRAYETAAVLLERIGAGGDSSRAEGKGSRSRKVRRRQTKEESH